MARPVEWTEERRGEILRLFLSYVENNTIPIIAEFAYQNHINRQRLYEREEFSDAIKECIAKKEANLEKGALTGTLNPSMCIFSLKQIGWTDKQQIEHSREVRSPIHDMLAEIVYGVRNKTT